MGIPGENPYLTRHQTQLGPRWAVDGNYLPDGFHLDSLLQRSLDDISETLASSVTAERADSAQLAPIEDTQQVWAAGVTYLRSRGTRIAESETADLYTKVYEADRVEVFFKATGWRTMGHGDVVNIQVGGLTLENSVMP